MSNNTQNKSDPPVNPDLHLSSNFVRNPNRHSLFLELFTAYLLWAAFGFIFFTHWLALLFLTHRYRPRNNEIRASNNSYSNRKFKRNKYGSILQHAFAIAALILFASGGAWCRTSGNSLPCPNEETMSHDCLFSVQTKKYQAIYTMHYIGLAYMAIQWVLDGLQLWGWVIQLRTGVDLLCTEENCLHRETGLMTVLWTPHFHLLSPAYPLVILFANLWVSLTWTVFYTEWSTSGGKLYSLGWRLIVAAVGALLGVATLFQKGFLHLCRKSEVTSNNDEVCPSKTSPGEISPEQKNAIGEVT